MDNIEITPGIGAPVATDDVAGIHFQKFKLDLGGDGLTVPASGDAANGLDVDVTRVSGTVSVNDGRGVPFNEFAENTAVVSTTDTPILTYVVPTGKTAYIEGYLVTGQAEGRFKLKLGTTVKSIIRTTRASISESVDFQHGAIIATTATSVTIVVYHSEIANQAFSANLFGYLV